MAAAPREAEARRQLVARAEAVGAMVMAREVACSALVHMVGELRGGPGISVVVVKTRPLAAEEGAGGAPWEMEVAWLVRGAVRQVVEAVSVGAVYTQP